MIDRHGKPICVGWSRTEILWLEAALTLKGEIKFAAFRDISEMSGRSYGAVLAKASDLAEEKKEAWIANLSASKKAKFAVNGSVPRTDKALEPSRLKALSKSQLMQGKAA